MSLVVYVASSSHFLLPSSSTHLSWQRIYLCCFNPCQFFSLSVLFSISYFNSWTFLSICKLVAIRKLKDSCIKESARTLERHTCWLVWVRMTLALEVCTFMDMDMRDVDNVSWRDICEKEVEWAVARGESFSCFKVKTVLLLLQYWLRLRYFTSTWMLLVEKCKI